ncbi:unnamed protein product [Oppiella nova]|uniref:Uncharacterized protein n=1 Tax=Oppiella nova TaxID=334625 RepID=A0A7R9LS69_9ACAR|nr:unnamed protein product [Oppiella nova]CAG2166460.1 unnamed protein product [Oppiella nova]
MTGSNSGIGEAIVKLFALLGAQVVITGRKETEIRKVSQEVLRLSPKGLKTLEVVADVTKTKDLEKLMSSTIKRFRKLDVLVNNPGIGVMATIRDKDFITNF